MNQLSSSEEENYRNQLKLILSPILKDNTCRKRAIEFFINDLNEDLKNYDQIKWDTIDDINLFQKNLNTLLKERLYKLLSLCSEHECIAIYNQMNTFWATDAVSNLILKMNEQFIGEGVKVIINECKKGGAFEINEYKVKLKFASFYSNEINSIMNKTAESYKNCNSLGDILKVIDGKDVPKKHHKLHFLFRNKKTDPSEQKNQLFNKCCTIF